VNVGNVNWSIERKAFSMTKKEDKMFKARVDGILLRRHDHRIMAILEVKPFVREKKEATIQRQEAAQMATWISSFPREDEANPGAGTSMTHEVYLTFAIFDDDYVRYVKGKAKAKDDTFLRMNRFGPFATSNPQHMACLAYYILAITLQKCR